MRQLLYVSNAGRGLAASDLDDILASSRANNGWLGVCGMLLYAGEGFLQILEGEERVLRDLYGRIGNDRRHQGPRLLLDREAPAAFAGLNMGFEHLRDGEPELGPLLGVARDAIRGRLSPGAGRVVATMLETFCRAQRSMDRVLLRATG